MTDDVPVDQPDQVQIERARPAGAAGADGVGEQVTQPAKLMRLGAMARQLLEEVRAAPLDDAARERLGALYAQSIEELSDSLSPELQAELRALSLPFDEQPSPSAGELRVAQAQLVGWLEGLFHGIQAAVMTQQLAARQQLEQIREPAPIGAGEGARTRAGTYL